MNKRAIIILVLCLLGTSLWAQDKREHKKNLIVREWNTKVGSTTPYLDNIVTYDSLGRKIEEIEYASYGQKKRIVYEYQGKSTRCSRQIEYNQRNRVFRIKKFQYNPDGTRKKQFNYKPNGKLESTKVFEYSYK